MDIDVIDDLREINVGTWEDVYYVKHGAKIRYIDPLFNGKRISKECKIAQKMLEKNLSYNMDKYIFLDKSLNILINNKI